MWSIPLLVDVLQGSAPIKPVPDSEANMGLKTVVTDERVLIVIPQRMSIEKRTIPYEEITGIDTETGRIVKK